MAFSFIKKSKKQSKTLGFTIIELIVVIFVIGILAVIVVLGYNGIRRRAIVSALTTDISSQQKLLETFKVYHGFYPNVLGCPNNDTTNTLCISERDPETKYTYIPDNPNNPQAFFLAGKKSEVVIETSNGSSPVEFLSKWSQVSSGNQHTCAINVNEQVYCWGNNTYGQLGRISPSYLSNSNSPIPIPVNNGGVMKGMKIKSITAGGNHTCAIDSSGQAYCWGYNSGGQVGNGLDDTYIPNPALVSKDNISGGVFFSSITAGGSHTCAVLSNKNAYCWGDNTYGQLGLGDLFDLGIYSNQIDKSNVPIVVYKDSINVVGYSGDVSQISAGTNHTCVVVSSRAICWGNNNKNQLGIWNSAFGTYRLPYRVNTAWAALDANKSYLSSGFLTVLNVVSVSAGFEHTCAVVASGSADQNMARCWGEGSAGQVGNNATSDRNYPVRTSALGSTNLNNISLGTSFSCAVNSAGVGYCWGDNTSGQIGQKLINTGYASPKILVTDNITGGAKFNQIDAGSDFACSAMTDSTIYCWGNNSNGQIGNNTMPTNVTLPTIISLPY